MTIHGDHKLAMLQKTSRTEPHPVPSASPASANAATPRGFLFDVYGMAGDKLKSGINALMGSRSIGSLLIL